MIIARFKAEKTDNTDEVLVYVREHIARQMFEVFVDGGLLGDGRDSAVFTNIHVALNFAAEQVGIALSGD